MDGKSVIGCDEYLVPTPMCTYNLYMNSVYVLDQVVYVPRRKERKLGNKMFSYVINWTVSNAYAIYKKLIQIGEQKPPNGTPISRREFKCLIS